MKTSNRIALIYGVSLLGAGAVALYRGRRGQDLLMDTALHGAVAGTVFNVVGWVAFEGKRLPVLAASNSSKVTLAKMPDKAIDVLSDLDTDTLYADLKENGVKIAPVPKNASVVIQDLN